MKALVSLTLVFLASLFGGWDPFHRPNPNVEEGNARVTAENYDGALEAYDRAARELPSAPGVHLDRGIAFLHKGDRERAREALLLAIGPETPPDLVADIRYDLGLSYFQDGEAAAAEDDHQTAQTAFRNAVDEYRRSLRARPSDHNTAWNLEIALRRLNEEREEQEREEQEQQDQQDQEQQDQDQQDQQDQDEQDQQDQEQQDQDQQDQDQQDQDQQDQDQNQQDSQDQQQQDGQDGQDEPSQPEQGQEPESSSGDEQNDPRDSQDQADGQQLPNQAQRVLDALQDGEESLEQYRAAQRGQRENRRVEQDW